MNLQILPLAITMMAGPQIMSALMLTTSKRPAANSAAFVSGVALTTSIGVVLYSWVGNALDNVVSLNHESEPSTAARIIQLLLVGLLIVMALRSYRGRAETKVPKWMEKLLEATPPKAFLLAAGLVFFMPTDIIAMLTVGINLTSNDLAVSDALPFILLTTFIAALPVLFYLVFYRRAQTFMPKVRDWMERNSWAVNIFVYVLFIFLIISD